LPNRPHGHGPRDRAATRYYLNLTEINSKPLVASNTVTACPYKGTTSRCWPIRVGGPVHQDLAWAYDFATRQL
jgi:uncharacterized protein (DUF427 family)